MRTDKIAMEYNYNLVEIDKFHGNSNEDLRNLYSSSPNQFSDCNRLISNHDSEYTTQASDHHASVPNIQPSMHKISSKPSISNQRILEDLSQSKSSKPLAQSSSLKTLQDNFSNRSQILIDEQHHMRLGSEVDIQRQMMHSHSNGNLSSDGKSTSIHISFSDNYIPEQRQLVQNQSKQFELNDISDYSHANGNSKLSNRYMF